jgi:hypothetical protein
MCIPKLISKYPDVKYYNIMYQLHKKNNNLDAANAIVEEGLVKYPSDKDLLVSKVNALNHYWKKWSCC